MSDCVEWGGSFTNGYGSIWDGKKNIYAHRETYKKHKGPIPKGMLIRHTCDNRRCVNPEHLILGTEKENNQDRWERGKPNKGELHGMSILNAQKVIEARRLKKEGVPLKVIAEEFNVKYQTIVSATNGSSWKHIKEGL